MSINTNRWERLFLILRFTFFDLAVSSIHNLCFDRFYAVCLSKQIDFLVMKMKRKNGKRHTEKCASRDTTLKHFLFLWLCGSIFVFRLRFAFYVAKKERYHSKCVQRWNHLFHIERAYFFHQNFRKVFFHSVFFFNFEFLYGSFIQLRFHAIFAEVLFSSAARVFSSTLLVTRKWKRMHN